MISPELKKPGVCYAVTDSGMELPIIDITHPVFRINATKEEIAEAIEKFVSYQQKQARIPAFIRKLQYNILYLLFIRNSFLGKALNEAHNSFLSGIATYIMKLGPDNVRGILSNKIDFVIMGMVPALALRLRLEDMARMMAAEATSLLQTNPGKPFHIISIAGGMASDSLNALIVMRKEHPGILEGREIVIQLLDLEASGPHFALRALDSLKQEGGPLQGLNISLRHILYDWSKPEALVEILKIPKHAVALLSSEGGLFEYGDNDIIVSNLMILNKIVSPDAVFVGTVSRDEGPILALKLTGSMFTIGRSETDFEAIAIKGGWKVTDKKIQILSRAVVLKKIG
jgi:hypothetical protein